MSTQDEIACTFATAAADACRRPFTTPRRSPPSFAAWSKTVRVNLRLLDNIIWIEAGSRSYGPYVR